MTRDEMKAKIRNFASRGKWAWSDESLERELSRLDREPDGTRVLFENTYMGSPQGLVLNPGPDWLAAAERSGRIMDMGTIEAEKPAESK